MHKPVSLIVAYLFSSIASVGGHLIYKVEDTVIYPISNLANRPTNPNEAKCVSVAMFVDGHTSSIYLCLTKSSLTCDQISVQFDNPILFVYPLYSRVVTIFRVTS